MVLNGNKLAPQSYEFIDQAPTTGLNYYRIKQTDHNGESTYSNIVYAEMGNSKMPSISLYPNPASSVTYLMNAQHGSLILKVLDALGSTVVYNKQQSPTDERLALDISNLPNGIYFVQISSEISPDPLQTIKLVVRH
jgi:hypothetical protein